MASRVACLSCCTDNDWVCFWSDSQWIFIACKAEPLWANITQNPNSSTESWPFRANFVAGAWYCLSRNSSRRNTSQCFDLEPRRLKKCGYKNWTLFSRQERLSWFANRNALAYSSLITSHTRSERNGIVIADKVCLRFSLSWPSTLSRFQFTIKQRVHDRIWPLYLKWQTTKKALQKMMFSAAFSDFWQVQYAQSAKTI